MHDSCSSYTNPHLFSSGRQARVSSDPSLDVEVTLTMAAQVDGAWGDVDVHQVVDDSALDVVEDTIDKETATHVHDLYVGQIPEETRESNQTCVILQKSFNWTSVSNLTCPELDPEAGRKTRSTWSSSWNPQWPPLCCSGCSPGCRASLAAKRETQEEDVSREKGKLAVWHYLLQAFFMLSLFV